MKKSPLWVFHFILLYFYFVNVFHHLTQRVWIQVTRLSIHMGAMWAPCDSGPLSASLKVNLDGGYFLEGIQGLENEKSVLNPSSSDSNPRVSCHLSDVFTFRLFLFSFFFTGAYRGHVSDRWFWLHWRCPIGYVQWSIICDCSVTQMYVNQIHTVVSLLMYLSYGLSCQ